MNSKDLNKQFDALKRRFTDLVADLHARKLAIPAAALLAAIVAAVVLLPKSPAAPPAPPQAATPPVVDKKLQQVAQISMIKPTPMGDDIPLASSSDPFTGSTGYDCQTVSSDPKTVDCDVSGITIRVICGKEDSSPACTTGSGGGSSGSAGAGSGSGSTGDSGTSDGGTGTPSQPTESETVYYALVARIKLDGKEYKDVFPETVLPRSSSPLVAYLNANLKDKVATFIAAEGVSMTGVAIDPIFGAFVLEVGQSATLTDSDGKNHKITLSKISYKQIQSPK